MLECSVHPSQEPAKIPASRIHPRGTSVSAGSGGFADIQKITLTDYHDQPSAVIAIKRFRQRAGYEIDNLKTLIAEELLVWKKLNNCPNVVDLFGIIDDPEQDDDGYLTPFLVSRFCTHGSLSLFMAQHGDGINETRRLELLFGISSGVAYIHSKAIVHGDLRANNVVVDGSEPDYVPKICDFGSSHSNCNNCYNGSKDKSRSFQWKSPELLRNGEPATTKSDVWAFGCLALEVQFEAIPFHYNYFVAMSMRSNVSIQPATEKFIEDKLKNNSTAQLVWKIMQRCWESECNQRPEADEVMNNLGSALRAVVQVEPVYKSFN